MTLENKVALIMLAPQILITVLIVVGYLLIKNGDRGE